MGLDIYLYTKAEAENDRNHSQEETDFYGEEWDIEHTEEEIAAFKANRKYTWGGSSDVPSEKYGSSTLCNRRYLRSSYNGGGFNSAVPQITANADYNFDWIFGEVKEYGDWRIPLDEAAVPRLQIARERAVEVANALRAIEKPVKAVTVSPNMFMAPPTKSEYDALGWYHEQVAKIPAMGDFFGSGGWSSGDGEFFGKDGLKVLAAVPGVGFGGVPAVHLVFELNEEATKSYIETADIVAEFVDEALDLIAKDGSCELHWSG